MRETIAEYIVAERDYRLATMPLSSHGQARAVSHNDPRLLRYRDARAALAGVVACGSCGTPIQADAMTGTTCACAPTIPMRGRTGKFALTKAGALAVLARTRQFFGGDDDYWDWDDGEPFDKTALDAAISATDQLAKAVRAVLKAPAGGVTAVTDLDSAIKAFDVVR